MRSKILKDLSYLDLDYFVGWVNLRNFANLELWELEILA